MNGVKDYAFKEVAGLNVEFIEFGYANNQTPIMYYLTNSNYLRLHVGMSKVIKHQKYLLLIRPMLQ